MSKVRARITPFTLGSVKAECTKDRKTGTVDSIYINDSAVKRMLRDGFAYTNIRKECVV